MLPHSAHQVTPSGRGVQDAGEFLAEPAFQETADGLRVVGRRENFVHVIGTGRAGDVRPVTALADLWKNLLDRDHLRSRENYGRKV